MTKPRREEDLDLGDVRIDDACQRTVVLIGGKGSGKSTAIRQLMRVAQEKKLPVIAMDPTGALISKDFNVIRVGHQYNQDQIKVLLRVMRSLWKGKQALVLDVSDLTREENSGFANEVFPEIFKYRDGMVMIDEVPEFVPQFGAFKSEELIRFNRKCRNKNIGTVLATQRPASVSKEVLALGDLYLVFRVVHPPDRETVSKLFALHYEDKAEINQVVDEMSHFPAGSCRVVDFVQAGPARETKGSADKR